MLQKYLKQSLPVEDAKVKLVPLYRLVEVQVPKLCHPQVLTPVLGVELWNFAHVLTGYHMALEITVIVLVLFIYPGSQGREGFGGIWEITCPSGTPDTQRKNEEKTPCSASFVMPCSIYVQISEFASTNRCEHLRLCASLTLPLDFSADGRYYDSKHAEII